MGTRAKISQSADPKVTLTIRIPLKEKIALVEEAKRRNITVTELIRKALQDILGISKKVSHWPNPRPLGIREFKREDLYE
jgi:hypothetical protein